ncbi:MAG: hypothetical protein J0H08_13580, partial [Rhizobiales bacterium]|nr:hypothetical protein [Hyphomicrobiales bacterium]
MRVGIVVAVVVAAYLVVVNVALNLPATQAFLTSTQNGRLAFTWDQAWTWLPFRLHVTNLRVNGESWSQQFEIVAPEVSGAIDIPSLLTRTVRFNDVVSGDLTVRFRPRPSPDKDDAELRPFYPEIPGRDPNSPAESVPTQSPGWMLTFDVDSITGTNDIWLAANRMTLEGTASAFVERQNKHGPLTVSDGQLDLDISSLTIAGKKVSDAGKLAGTFGIASFIPQENRGAKVLEFLEMDADIDLPMDGLDFLSTFLTAVADMTVNGRGRLMGHLAMAQGKLTPGADVTIEAENLQVDLPPYAVYGTGRVVAKVDAANPAEIEAQLGFANITAIHTPSKMPLFNGTDIGISVVRSAIVFPEELTEEVPRSVNMTLPSVSVPDISVYQRYLPDEWNAQLVGGAGSLEGHAAMSAGALDLDLTLRSEDAKLRLTKDIFESALVLAVKGKGTADQKTASIDVSGTSGDAAFVLPDDQDESTGVVGFWSLFQKKDLKSMLASVDGMAKGKLVVSDLDWVTVLFKKPFSLDIANSAEVDADLTIAAGRLTADSSLAMAPTQFTLGILDYIVEGTGGFALAIARADTKPDLSLTASLGGASLRLADEKTAVVSDVTINAVAPDRQDHRHVGLQHLSAAEFADQAPQRHGHAQRQAPDDRPEQHHRLHEAEDVDGRRRHPRRPDIRRDRPRHQDPRRLGRGAALQPLRFDPDAERRAGHRPPRHRRLERRAQDQQGQHRVEEAHDARRQRLAPHEGRPAHPRDLPGQPEGEQVARQAARPPQHQRPVHAEDRARQHRRPLRLRHLEHLRRRRQGHLRGERRPGRVLCADRQARRRAGDRQPQQEVRAHRRDAEVRSLQARRPAARDQGRAPGPGSGPAGRLRPPRPAPARGQAQEAAVLAVQETLKPASS